jgi:hypothetical protein
MRLLYPPILFITAALSVGCGSTVSSGGDDDGGSGGTVVVGPTMVGAHGVMISKVTFNQGVERLLMLDGLPQASNVPLITDRGGLLRVHYSAPNLAGTPVTGRLTYADGTFVEQEVSLYNASSDSDLNSTMNFDVPAERINGAFTYGVSILGPGDAGTGNPGALWPNNDTMDSHAVTGVRNVLRLKIVPYVYNADGSGRVPDTSEAALAGFKNHFKSLYPVSDVIVTAHAPRNWNGFISPNGSGWQEVMGDVYNLRLAEGAVDEYYYGLFNPTNTISQFCQQGCLLGVTLLNAMPSDVGDPELRWAIGLGFPQTGASTMGHELGHSHGRGHAPCGNGLDPQSIDTAFPHAGGKIGVWGWDIVNKALINPAGASDLMGYCDNEWISDYNFIALYERSKFVNLPDVSGDIQVSLGERFDVISIGPDGASYVANANQSGIGTRAQPVMLDQLESDARVVNAAYLPYDHIDGGWLFVPSDGTASSIDAVVDGQTLHVDIPSE